MDSKEEVHAILAEITPSIEKEIEAVMPRNGKPSEVYSLLWDVFDRGGKRFRPALCVLCCEAVGGKSADAMPIAAAIELFHNMTLVHDDIEDSSKLRRGKPCLHVEFGVPLALNAGDGLFVLTWKAILRSGASAESKIEVQKLLTNAFMRVLEGQAVELGWYRRDEWGVSEQDYVKMVMGKTGVLIGAACEVGIAMGGGTIKQREALRRFGECIGVAFQIQDDILNVTGEEKKYKKEIGGDLVEGKRTLMVIHTLQKADAMDRAKLLELIKRKSGRREDIAEIVELFRKYRAIEFAADYAKMLVSRAKKELGALDAGEPATKKIMKLADFLVDREV